MHFFLHIHIQTFEPTSRLLARTRSSASSRHYTGRLECDAHPGFELLHLLLASLHGDLLSFIQAVLQVFDGLLHVLLHALQVSLLTSFSGLSNFLIPAASLSLKRALKSIHNSLVVSLRLLHFFILLSQLALDVSLYLVKLKLGSENLPFLMLQCGLSQMKQ
uniref:Uncharacterized protein n=1 Tax=Amphilophus citrinellus TaxID=61819 RepID=A0A3Q0QWJ2_AMPCI